MARANGIYTLPSVYQATPGTTIRSEQHNVPLEDIASALTGSLPRDGSAPMQGNLPMGGRKITGLGAPTASTDVATKGYVDGKGATQEQAQEGTDNSAFMTALRVAQYVASWFTSKIATTEQARTATVNDVIMTPARVFDWFGDQRPTAAEASAGTSALKIMTPLATRQAFNATGAAPVYATRAWGDFTEAGGTGAITINGSGNVASVTRVSIGVYRITFTTPMPVATYSVASTGLRPDNAFSMVSFLNGSAKTTTEFTLTLRTNGNDPVAGTVSFQVVC